MLVPRGERFVFVRGIEVAAEFTRPIHSITRSYGASVAKPGAATLFFVNDEGWALTCRHVTEQLLASNDVNLKYREFKGKVASPPKGKSPKAWRKKVAGNYGYGRDTVVQILNRFIDCGDMTGLKTLAHETVDLALIHFQGFTKIPCKSFPLFAADGAQLRQGQFLCRLGFPFPEFDNFEYDEASDEIRWTDSGRSQTPRFPIEGMVTRHLDSPIGITGFELSTPGLRGQSGGPVFDEEGRVWGMQSSTAHLDLHFDIDQQVLRHGTKKRIQDYAFLHVGHCIHVNPIREFLTHHGVRFDQG